MSSITLPPRETITAYLEKHPLTYSLDKRILRAVAAYFENSTRHIPRGVLLTLSELETPLKNVKILREDLTAALADCAERQKITIQSSL